MSNILFNFLIIVPFTIKLINNNMRFEFVLYYPNMSYRQIKQRECCKILNLSLHIMFSLQTLKTLILTYK